MNKQKTIHEVLSWASLFLQTNGCEESGALLLLEHHLKVDRSNIYMNMKKEIAEQTRLAIERDAKSHVETGVPIQHLIGSTEFYGRTFNVNADVLIPRFETEELVEEALRLIKKYELANKGTVVDLGTGSGVIATTIACSYPEMKVYATDISETALQVARANMETHGADVTCLQGDFAAPLIEQGIQVDVIVSNPPYIAHRERSSLSRTVRNFDPSLALFADNEGLAAYETILAQVEHILKPKGIILFEIGATQGKAIQELIKEIYPQSNVTILRDINQKDRIVRALL